MRFMLLMIPRGYERAQAGTMPDAKAVEAMMVYNRVFPRGGSRACRPIRHVGRHRVRAPRLPMSGLSSQSNQPRFTAR